MSMAASFKQWTVNLVTLRLQFKFLRLLVCGGTKQDIEKTYLENLQSEGGFHIFKKWKRKPSMSAPVPPGYFHTVPKLDSFCCHLQQHYRLGSLVR